MKMPNARKIKDRNLPPKNSRQIASAINDVDDINTIGSRRVEN